jgi:hypothetical protein
MLIFWQNLESVNFTHKLHEVLGEIRILAVKFEELGVIFS